MIVYTGHWALLIAAINTTISSTANKRGDNEDIEMTKKAALLYKNISYDKLENDKKFALSICTGQRWPTYIGFHISFSTMHERMVNQRDAFLHFYSSLIIITISSESREKVHLNELFITRQFLQRGKP